ncbi:MAG TPA: NifU family protein [Solirubrobacterales bacterium]|jgi:Fe-S cluster biogenesis protein NfuA/nitrite reductase/ring-hydroxylating ferredoxin subunit
MPAESAQAVSPETLIQRVEELTEQVERLPDPAARRTAEELMSAVIDMYGLGLSRIVEILDEDEDGAEVKRRLIDDGVIASLLLIHDLYPVPIEDRVSEALDNVRPYMESHGGDVELVSLIDGIARIRLEGSCDGCPASASTLELAIKTALDETAPDLLGIEVEGTDQDLLSPVEVTGNSLPVVPAGRSNGAAETPAPAGVAGWRELNGELDGLREDQLTRVEVEGMAIVVAKVEGSLLAYLDSCPSCEGSIAEAELDEGMLTCPGCQRRYFLPRAGRSLDDERLHLGPVPLLASETDGIRVALAR